jgi:hypothetical protein
VLPFWKPHGVPRGPMRVRATPCARAPCRGPAAWFYRVRGAGWGWGGTAAIAPAPRLTRPISGCWLATPR